MTDSSIDKVAVAVAKQGEAIKSFRQRQDERISDVSKRIDEIEAKGISPGKFSVIDTPGYSQVYGAIDNLVHSTPFPRLAAAAVLNAVCSVALTTMGGDALADLLRETADRVPAAEAKAKNQLS
jgi:hypothetical protein